MVPPPTLLSLHAHPDDEAMLTGQLLAKAAALGWRTIVVYGTDGGAGETDADLGSETLGQRRSREAEAACAELGVARVEWLGYADSGMAGRATNSAPGAFCNASVDQLVAQVADRVVGETVQVVVGYDANGTYGHPDHLQVYRTAHALARHLQVSWLLEATFNRDHLASLPDSDGTVDPGFGAPASDITHFVQGEASFRAKMEAIKRHDSQVRRKPGARPRRGIDGWRRRFGTDWLTARPLGDDRELDALGALLEPLGRWPGPLG